MDEGILLSGMTTTFLFAYLVSDDDRLNRRYSHSTFENQEMTFWWLTRATGLDQ